MNLNEEQKKTQISSSHRLISLVERLRHQLDTMDGRGSNYTIVHEDYFVNEILGKLENKLNTTISKRQSALLKRIKGKFGNHNSNKLTAVEYAAEALFDGYFFKNNEQYINRSETVSIISENINKHKEIILAMPVLSRKPFSPIKNKGYFPDIGEINTLLRCAKLAKLISNISNYPCKFIILADGNKYNRACKTPYEVVDLYQQSLNYWVKYLHIDDFVEVVDYEKWISDDSVDDWDFKRHVLNKRLYHELSSKYDRFFDANNPQKTFQYIQNDDIGKQLSHTYWSIITSVNYHSLFPDWHKEKQIFTRENQNFYVSFIASLNFQIDRLKKSHLFSSDIVGALAYDAIDTIFNMRKEAWEAAKQYVSISLTDRKLNTIYNKLPSVLKLTIHAKKGEYNFISTNAKDYAMTAQHTVAGIKNESESISVDYKYRLFRESEDHTKIYISSGDKKGKEFDPLYEMNKINQPMYYIKD
ncbi:L-tyrosine/L-tryptophan isonitrile synthase family protein [Pectobacterium sp. A5351]|uniref:L-tyrosine/L-tryptophan isonitrile synthase family protein n=1 Tax=Pectobacterium sp. A5351 TaxID=2914983 RepID=UPI00232B5C6B|nr:L-tyrosine/L-tryptophan isonitrile synthase family protein [Pectobacterium sp. A5351]WCG81527.1 L-tyrosine/L-tryptophan isonitrile synthase family protein [Pectobacterium sp. A5351]